MATASLNKNHALKSEDLILGDRALAGVGAWQHVPPTEPARMLQRVPRQLPGMSWRFAAAVTERCKRRCDDSWRVPQSAAIHGADARLDFVQLTRNPLIDRDHRQNYQPRRLGLRMRTPSLVSRSREDSWDSGETVSRVAASLGLVGTTRPRGRVVR